MEFTPQKLYYRIGEVCEILGVEPHVLRYWESEFSRLSPPKNKSGQRTYRAKDIELLLRIRRLLYQDGFTIAGARKRLLEAHASDHGSNSSGASPAQEAFKSRSQCVQELREELENILTLLNRE